MCDQGLTRVHTLLTFLTDGHPHDEVRGVCSPHILGCCVTEDFVFDHDVAKSAPHKALNLIECGTLTNDGRVVPHRVGSFPTLEQAYLTESVYKVVLQKSIPAQIL